MFEGGGDIDFDDDFGSNSNKKQPPVAQIVVAKSPERPRNGGLRPVSSVKRRFPGPAGILPDCKEFDLNSLESLNKASAIQGDVIPCSQASVSVFQDALWTRIVEDYRQFMRSFNIQWIKEKAALKQLANQKAPFLAAIIQNIDCFDKKKLVVNVILKDSTGTISGTILYNLYEEHKDDLSIGSVIILQQFSVLTTVSNSNNYLLTITEKNLVSIYARNPESEIRKIQIREISKFEDITNKLAEIPNVIGLKQKKLATTNVATPVGKRRFNFTKVAAVSEKKTKIANDDDVGDVTFSCSQVSVKTTLENKNIWENALEGVNADDLFGDF